MKKAFFLSFLVAKASSHEFDSFDVIKGSVQINIEAFCNSTYLGRHARQIGNLTSSVIRYGVF